MTRAWDNEKSESPTGIEPMTSGRALYPPSYENSLTIFIYSFTCIYLHWLPVKYRIMFKLVVYTFKALHGYASTYIHKLIRLKPRSNYNLRSNTKYLLLDLPNKTKKPTGDRAFFPDELRALGSLKTFMAQLKTHYFKLAYSL